MSTTSSMAVSEISDRLTDVNLTYEGDAQPGRGRLVLRLRGATPPPSSTSQQADDSHAETQRGSSDVEGCENKDCNSVPSDKTDVPCRSGSSPPDDPSRVFPREDQGKGRYIIFPHVHTGAHTEKLDLGRLTTTTLFSPVTSILSTPSIQHPPIDEELIEFHRYYLRETQGSEILAKMIQERTDQIWTERHGTSGADQVSTLKIRDFIYNYNDALETSIMQSIANFTKDLYDRFTYEEADNATETKGKGKSKSKNFTYELVDSMEDFKEHVPDGLLEQLQDAKPPLDHTKYKQQLQEEWGDKTCDSEDLTYLRFV
ncbi:uncharacterized protein L199_006983 [Kwoniella botswanensis]|uniref:uncharacterized protein n=1 Tax=Kwoniella botswanensis TaxID=1268659 RepID=UPI00315DE9F0